MAVLEILEYPDTRLRTVAKPVAKVDDSIREIVDNMFETMLDANGIGLAATQVNIHQQIIVIDVSENRDQPHVLINPKYTPLDDETEMMQEGCLSVPEYYADVERALRVRLNALDRNGDAYELEADGLLAHCIQHECDHLQGKVFVDYLSTMKRNRVRKLMDKRHKEQNR
ncbi:peptide deformylase [Oceanospirillum linum]|uniref:Peptide deformylase n=1 Tax=Oceanospirillum linum TaxID=966 RepID=A0A1T1HC56_OCELI|nr:peptide deformylase [Oceanospirillum linum]OOV87383.1 peptide deformylase [Oceanospirillum linum]SEF83368.1 peptide deformylase [Oleiphilus messinensis]SMP19682.1 peptide deformylase [Oceanospirillum linum]